MKPADDLQQIAQPRGKALFNDAVFFLAQRLKRVFNIDITLCGDAVRAIADITHPGIIQKILVYIEAQPAPLKLPQRANPKASCLSKVTYH
jgi:hypothetical protein